MAMNYLKDEWVIGGHFALPSLQLRMDSIICVHTELNPLPLVLLLFLLSSLASSPLKTNTTGRWSIFVAYL